jgi:hypothetical protein
LQVSSRCYASFGLCPTKTASEASGNEVLDVFEYMLWLIWMCLSLTPAILKNPVYAMVLSTQDVLEQLMSDSLLVFVPGLLEVLKATTPPTIAFFKTLPTEVKK